MILSLVLMNNSTAFFIAYDAICDISSKTNEKVQAATFLRFYLQKKKTEIEQKYSYWLFGRTFESFLIMFLCLASAEQIQRKYIVVQVNSWLLIRHIRLILLQS